MSKATGETEHLKDMLVGNILAVSKHDVIKTAICTGALACFILFSARSSWPFRSTTIRRKSWA